MPLTAQEREFENNIREQKFKALKEVLKNDTKFLIITVCEHDVAIDELESRIEQLEVMLNAKGN